MKSTNIFLKVYEVGINGILLVEARDLWVQDQIGSIARHDLKKIKQSNRKT